MLTKINTDILLDGIVRDDRKLEDAIKDMEQLMYDIEDNKLSYNNVDDIFEYNKAFETNPQNLHLFVLVDFPNNIREDLAQRIMKIIQIELVYLLFLYITRLLNLTTISVLKNSKNSLTTLKNIRCV